MKYLFFIDDRAYQVTAESQEAACRILHRLLTPGVWADWRELHSCVERGEVECRGPFHSVANVLQASAVAAQAEDRSWRKTVGQALRREAREAQEEAREAQEEAREAQEEARETQEEARETQEEAQEEDREEGQEEAQEDRTVIVTIRTGIVEHITQPKGTKVIVRDYDAPSHPDDEEYEETVWQWS